MDLQPWSPLSHAVMTTIVQRPVSVLTFATFEDMSKRQSAKSYSEIVCGIIDNFFCYFLKPFGHSKKTENSVCRTKESSLNQRGVILYTQDRIQLTGKKYL